jgi:hypothetical protein
MTEPDASRAVESRVRDLELAAPRYRVYEALGFREVCRPAP